MIHPRTMDSICKTIATMKKLFKNLMLVAVAAMAFVGCSQEGNEVNILTKETTFEFTAGFNEDTRSGFGEKEGDAYPSVWYGGESIIAIFSNEDGVIGTAYSSIDDLGEGVESSKTATFTVKYEGSLPDNYSVTFYSGSWNTNYETGEAYYYISDNQRCTDTSVESSNHLCKTEAIEVVNGEISTLNLTFNTATAFGKVTMEQFSEVADKIAEVKVTINGNTTYTVTPNALTKPVVWFACEAIESVTSLVVEAKVDGVTYIKTKEDIAEGALSFNTGRVRPINVKDMTEKPADYNVVLTKVTKIDGNTISFAGEDSNDKLTLAINPGLETIVAGTYTGVDATYGPGFSSDSALEYDYNSSTFNISAAYNESYDLYLSGNPIVITDLGDNNFSITTTTSTWIPVDNANKTVKITFEGKFEVEIPKFTSATAELSTYDIFLNFNSDVLGTLRLDYYGNASEKCIYPGTYGFTGDWNQFYSYGYSHYTPVGGSQNSITDGSVIVSIVDGQYHFEFNVTYGSETLIATYTGQVENINIPDTRDALAEPTNIQTTVNGKSVTITWDPVEGAVKYNVYSDYEDIYTEDTTVTFEFPEYATNYNVFIKAIADENSDQYKNRDYATYLNVTTGEDPTPRIIVNVELLTFKADGGEQTFNVTIKNIEGTLSAVAVEEKFGVTVDTENNTVTVSAEANTSDQPIEDTIIITCGDVSVEIPVKQNGVVAAGTQDGKSEETAFVYTNCTVSLDSYACYVFEFSGGADGTTFKLNSNKTDLGALSGVTALNTNIWYATDSTYSGGEVDWSKSEASIELVDGINSCKFNYIKLNVNGNDIYYTYENVINKL